MTSLPRKRAALLLISLLLTACSASGPRSPSPPVQPAQIPLPSPELMTTPETGSLPNVPQLLSDWTRRLEAWRARLAHCRDMPAKCA